MSSIMPTLQSLGGEPLAKKMRTDEGKSSKVCTTLRIQGMLKVDF
jgi:hypothetical protein